MTPGNAHRLEVPVVRYDTDVLIVGGGAAGTMAAFECAEAGVPVIQVTKGRATSGTTTVARGGFAAAVGKDDSPELHLQDILKYGGELIDPALARVWVYDIVQVVRDLESWGAEFVRGADGALDLKMFPSHSRPRAVHHYDTTGNMLTKVVSKKLRADARIDKHSITAIVDLIKRDGRVIGAWGVDYQNGAIVIYRSQQTILCTGGGSGLFYVNDNPPQVTGDGYVLGFRAGVPLLGIEMIDFQAMCCSPRELFGFAPHPTGFINAGAVFRNQEGEEFLKRYFPETAEASTRSEVILAMAQEIHAGRATPTGGIFMDATKVSLDVIQKMIPYVYKTCLHKGIDITKIPLEVAPGSHTWLGGLKIDVDGKTPVDGLFAAGETAGGIHGGNRIGGSALSSSLVFGRRAGRRAAALVKETRVELTELTEEAISPADRDWLASLIRREDGPLQSDVRTSCRMLAHSKLGPIRDDKTLREALAEYERIEREDVPMMRLDDGARTSDKVRGYELESALSVRNLALLGRILATAALRRTESRGAHFRLDCPETNDALWRVVTRLESGTDGKIEFHKDPVKDAASDMTALLSVIEQLASAADSLKSLQGGIVTAISQLLPHYDWVGFYMLDPNDTGTLVLGPFVGDPTPHVRIPVNQGICGAAVASGTTIVVDDVNADPRYLSCSIKTKSEIVVPIYAQGIVVGELDIDSHTPAAFTDADRLFLEEAARIVGRYMEK